jgi:hypothetical protein
MRAETTASVVGLDGDRRLSRKADAALSFSRGKNLEPASHTVGVKAATLTGQNDALLIAEEPNLVTYCAVGERLESEWLKAKLDGMLSVSAYSRSRSPKRRAKTTAERPFPTQRRNRLTTEFQFPNPSGNRAQAIRCARSTAPPRGSAGCRFANGPGHPLSQAATAPAAPTAYRTTHLGSRLASVFQY